MEKIIHYRCAKTSYRHDERQDEVLRDEGGEEEDCKKHGEDRPTAGEGRLVGVPGTPGGASGSRDGVRHIAVLKNNYFSF